MTVKSSETLDDWKREVWCECFGNIAFEKGYLEHSHPNYEIAYFSKAATREFIVDTSYEIRDGDTVLIDEYEFHRIIGAQGQIGSGYVLHFKRGFVEKFLKFFDAESLLPRVFKPNAKVINLNLRQRETMEIHLSSILKTYEKHAINPHDTIVHAALVSQIFNLLFFLSKHLPADLARPAASKTSEIIQGVIMHIDGHFREPMNLDGLSLTFCINKYYLSHVFKEHTGFTLFEYILHRRIIEARKLLKNTTLDVDGICQACGFVNKHYFYKAFKKVTGTTPHAFRKSGGVRRIKEAM